jgi:hypothetical protein
MYRKEERLSPPPESFELPFEGKLSNSRSQKSEVGSRSEQLVGDCNSPLIEDRA